MRRALILCAGLLAACTPAPPSQMPELDREAIAELLASAERIENQQNWFEIIQLPNDVYALWEPGHAEQVNSFFIVGENKDLLYDTGMGIASTRLAISEIRRSRNLDEKPLMVVNSHNHLDHNGGNAEYDAVWVADDDWARHRLSSGVPAGPFEAYWQALRAHPGVRTPDTFDPATHAIPPYPLEQVQYLSEGDILDLGNRQFSVIRTYSHSPDGIALFDADKRLFFGGDAFYGPNYLVSDLQALPADLQRVKDLDVRWHYASHGPQLVTAMQHGRHLATVRQIIVGEGETGLTHFAGAELPVRSLNGVTVTIATDLLLY